MSHHAEIEVRHPRSTSSYTPSTFVERGVAVPFTTPLLGGARLRRGDRDAPELIVFNPNGARGVYVVAWSGVPALCTPTLHDRMLFERLQAASTLSPATVRQAALQVAREGFAGRPAAAAAAAALALQARLTAATREELLRALAAQVSAPSGAPPSGAAEPAAAAADRTLALLAGRLGRSPDALAARLDSLAASLAPLGVGAATAEARVPATLRALAEMQAALRAWLEASPAAASSPDAELVLRAAELTTAASRALLDELLQPLRDVPALLRSWLREPEPPLRTARLDWLLDGWTWICLLWQDAGGGSERLLAEMADLVPALPREAGEWAATLTETPGGVMRGRRGQSGRPEDWRAGPLVGDRIARNERLLTRTVAVA